MTLLTGKSSRLRPVWQRWKNCAESIVCGDTVLLNQDFKEFIESLNSNDVRYLVIGGYAVAFHGHPRYTKDLDVWVEPTEDNARNLLQALAEFGFASLGLTVDDFVKSDQMVQLGFPPYRIDLLTFANGLSFADSYQRRQLVTVDQTKVNFVSLDDLRANKRATGRYQDLADIEALS